MVRRIAKKSRLIQTRVYSCAMDINIAEKGEDRRLLCLLSPKINNQLAALLAGYFSRLVP